MDLRDGDGALPFPFLNLDLKVSQISPVPGHTTLPPLCLHKTAWNTPDPAMTAVLTSVYPPRHSRNTQLWEHSRYTIISSKGYTEQISGSSHQRETRAGQMLWDPRPGRADLLKSTLKANFHTLFHCFRAQKVLPWGKIQTVTLRWGEWDKVWAHCVFKVWGWRWG